MATIKKLRTIIRYSSVQDEPILVKPGPTTKSIPRTQINTIGHPVQLKMAPQTVAAVLGLRSLLNAFKGSIDYAKGLVNSKYLTYPSVKGSVIREFSIKRDEYTIIEGIKYKNECDSSMDAEWIFQDVPDTGELNTICKKRVVLFIHGGAYVIGTIKLYRSITSRIAQYADASVLAINYRLSPAHVYPIPLIDAITAYKYLLDSGYEPNNISIVGDSAGAGIATALMLYCRDSSNVPMPACVACMSPYYDLTHALPSWRLNEVSCYLPEGILDLKYISETRSNLAVGHDGDLRKPLASPIFAKPAKKRICPLLIQVGSCERVRDDGLYFYSHSLPHDPIRLEVYQDSVHFFQMFADIDKFAVHGLKRLGHFVREFSGQVTKPDLTRSASFIYNSPNFPFAPIPDVEGIIHDGVEELLKNGIWKINEHGDIIVAEIMQIDRNSFQ